MSRLVLRLKIMAARLRRNSTTVRERFEGADPNQGSGLEAVYVHFNPTGAVHDYVHNQLRELVNCGFRITFVSSSPELAPDTVSDVKPMCSKIIWRHNIGYDFGGYCDGIKSLGPLNGVRQLVLMNDSVYGPLWPLQHLLGSFDEERCDFWGVTDSWQHAYHLQSYFLCLYPKAFLHPAFAKFWRKFLYVADKQYVIRKGEIRLTQALVRSKLRAEAFCEYWKVHAYVKDSNNNGEGAPAFAALPAAAASRTARTPADTGLPVHEQLAGALKIGTPMNPTHHFWNALMTHFRSPFLKRELLVTNPAQAPNAWEWEKYVEEVSDYPVELIRNHLKTI